jgi:putative acetyltransferase
VARARFRPCSARIRSLRCGPICARLCAPKPRRQAAVRRKFLILLNSPAPGPLAVGRSLSIAKVKGRFDCMHFERTAWDDIRFKELTGMLDNELHGNYEALQTFYDKKNVIKSNSYVVLCIDKECPIACGCIRETEDESTVELKRMYTIKEERGKGIGKILVEELEKWAFEMRKSKIILETGNMQEAAIAMYKKIGFIVIENYGEYKGISNSICMAKEIRLK